MTSACRNPLRFSLIVSLCFAAVSAAGKLCPAEAPSKESIAEAVLAGELVERAGVRRGVCAVLGRESNLAVELARASELLVHVRTPETEDVRELRRLADEADLDLNRLVVERGGLGRLPYADNIVDVVITTNATEDLLEELPAGEVLRALRPEGIALVGSSVSAEGLKRWAAAANAAGIKTWSDERGHWLQFSKPPLAGAGDWSHWEHSPDNNPVSEDQIIKFPYMTQFMAEPMYIAMPSITTAAGGRTFLAIGHIAHHEREWDMMNKLIARNGYNGTVLWERPLPEGYVVHRSAFIATKDSFYMIDGNGALALDPQTGREQGEVRIPGVNGYWKWMVKQGDTLYVLAGRKDPAAQTIKGDRTFGGWSWADLSRGYYTRPHVPWGFGDTLAAYDLKENKLLWRHQEEKPIDSRSLALKEDKLFLYCPGAHLRALDLQTGEIRWTNDDKETLALIEEPGQNLTSTPGFRSACLTVATPDALIIQGQTRNNVVAISTSDGYLLWKKSKVTNNPNAIFVDGRVILGVGQRGSHVALDPISGAVLEDLGFMKRACTRLTASSDSFFVRGEGTLRYDRNAKKVLVDGAIRPACNDGALPANGLLYLGPWQCDCNLSLIGNIAKCSAGDFRFDIAATTEERLDRGTGDDDVAAFDVSPKDWSTGRGNVQRSGSTSADVAVEGGIRLLWESTPRREILPTSPISAGDAIFVAGEDGKIRAIDAESGREKWSFATAGPIKEAPTVAEGRVYAGSGDGYAYCLEAATGRLLWRFRAAPVERHILVYGHLTSTWPVNSGVLVNDGVAYFAAGIIDYDGTYVYAVDAKTGELFWQNNSSGHLNEELRKGVSVQGNLTIQGNRLLLAGGNQVSPAAFDLKTGECLNQPKEQGTPQANNGKFVGVFADDHVIAGGRILLSAARNVSTKGSFMVFKGNRRQTLNFGGIPPVWDEGLMAMVNFKRGKLTVCRSSKVTELIAKGLGLPRNRADRAGNRRRFNLAAALQSDGAHLWQSDLGESNKFEALSLAVCPNAVVAVVQNQQKFRAQPQWYVVAFDRENGRVIWRNEMQREPLPGGLAIDRNGRVLVTSIDGSALAYGRNASSGSAAGRERD